MNRVELHTIAEVVGDRQLKNDIAINHGYMCSIDREAGGETGVPGAYDPVTIPYGQYRFMMGTQFFHGVSIGLKLAPYAFAFGAGFVALITWAFL